MNRDSGNCGTITKGLTFYCWSPRRREEGGKGRKFTQRNNS